MLRNFLLRVRKERRGLFLPPIYYVEISDGESTIEVREEMGFRVETKVKFPKNILSE